MASYSDATRHIGAKLVIGDTEYKVVDMNIYSDINNNGDKLLPGVAACSELTAKIKARCSDGLDGKTVQAYALLSDAPTYLNSFIVTDVSEPSCAGVTTIRALDLMSKAEVDYISTLSYPAMISEMAAEISAITGLTIEHGVGSTYSDIEVQQPPVGYTCREILSFIAGMCGCFCTAVGSTVRFQWYTAGQNVPRRIQHMDGLQIDVSGSITHAVKAYSEWELGSGLVGWFGDLDLSTQDGRDALIAMFQPIKDVDTSILSFVPAAWTITVSVDATGAVTGANLSFYKKIPSCTVFSSGSVMLTGAGDSWYFQDFETVDGYCKCHVNCWRTPTWGGMSSFYLGWPATGSSKNVLFASSFDIVKNDVVEFAANPEMVGTAYEGRNRDIIETYGQRARGYLAYLPDPNTAEFEDRDSFPNWVVVAHSERGFAVNNQEDTANAFTRIVSYTAHFYPDSFSPELSKVGAIPDDGNYWFFSTKPVEDDVFGTLIEPDYYYSLTWKPGLSEWSNPVKTTVNNNHSGFVVTVGTVSEYLAGRKDSDTFNDWVVASSNGFGGVGSVVGGKISTEIQNLDHWPPVGVADAGGVGLVPKDEVEPGDYTNPLINDGNLDAVQAQMPITTYTPGSLRWRGNPASGTGKIISVETKTGAFVPFAISRQSLHCSPGMVDNCTCDGNETTDFVRISRNTTLRREIARIRIAKGKQELNTP